MATFSWSAVNFVNIANFVKKCRFISRFSTNYTIINGGALKNKTILRRKSNGT
jgi:hypothetical protein